jgi:16S rRNA (cytosine1402-N4)-methyltransferase
MMMLPDDEYHITVLLHEGVDALMVRSDGVYVDATLGAGGHTKLLLEKLGPEGRVFGFDQDADALANAPSDKRFVLCNGNFQFLKRYLLAHGVESVDGVLADLGVSGHHFDMPERGFSFRFDAPLDMRMNQAQGATAADVLNNYEEAALTNLFWRYGESNFGRAIAKGVVRERDKQLIQTTADFVRIIESVVPEHKLKGELPKLFQAIRIEVNQELEVLKSLLVQASEILKPNGRVVVISYHSLEDRIVKHFFRSGNFEDIVAKDLFGNVLRTLDPEGKVISPSKLEIENNPRARSAKMRIAVKR